jgi:NitT/TauT family transport system permease protein
MRPERKARLIASMPAWIATISLFLIWEISVHVFQIREFILPAPSAIWKACVAVWPNLLSHSLATLGTVMMGFLASVAISLPLAMLIASSPTISAAIYPL